MVRLMFVKSPGFPIAPPRPGLTKASIIRPIEIIIAPNIWLFFLPIFWHIKFQKGRNAMAKIITPAAIGRKSWGN
ncbi:MAG: hypothetical protein BWX72_01746 [Firmicutes bacterium ADurb.Bin080]|nr:MAG: hypothetical protein BWX72_01746 [Firmicutes bacterium ADurb.Bin080]